MEWGKAMENRIENVKEENDWLRKQNYMMKEVSQRMMAENERMRDEI